MHQDILTIILSGEPYFVVKYDMFLPLSAKERYSW